MAIHEADESVDPVLWGSGWTAGITANDVPSSLLQRLPVGARIAGDSLTPRGNAGSPYTPFASCDVAITNGASGAPVLSVARILQFLSRANSREVQDNHAHIDISKLDISNFGDAGRLIARDAGSYKG